MNNSKQSSFLLLFFTFVIIYGFSSQITAREYTSRQIIEKTERLLRGDTSYSRAQIIIQKKRITRKMLFDNWDDRKNKESFIRILSPKKDQGISFLKLKKNLWQYIPKIGREIKIEDSLMQDSWMGSDFSNDDLVRESSIVHDYHQKFANESRPNLYAIILTPRPGAPVVWDKIIAYIHRNSFLPQSYEFYDHKNRLRRKLVFSDVKKFQGRKFPSKRIMNTIKNNKVVSSTVIQTIKLNFNQKIPSRIFSKSNLRR